MSKTFTGACLCGGVGYELTDPEAMGVCHCTRCQRWTGSSLTGVVVDPSNFKITKGQDLIKTYAYKAAWEAIGDDAPQYAENPPA